MSKDGDPRNIRVLSFLEAYEKQECLWNPTLNSYKIKADRDAAYDEIIRELDVPMLTPHDIKLKIKGIRTTYTKELRIMNRYKQLGKPYKPKLFWFKKANSFLRNVCVSRKKSLLTNTENVAIQNQYKDGSGEYTSDISADEMADNEEDDSKHMLKSSERDCSGSMDYKTIVHVVNQDDIHTEHTRRRPTIEQLPAEQFEEHIINSEQPPPADSVQRNDEFEVFCRSVAAQLRSIPDSYSRSVAKLKIQQILFEAETGHYKTSPCITIPIVQQINNL